MSLSWADTMLKDHEYFDNLEDTLELLKLSISKIRSKNPTVKNNDKSEMLRQRGNRYFIKNNFGKALEEFTESLCYAENNSLQKALAYSNRSAVLFEKCYYTECLEDITRALDCGYPEEKKSKLKDRRQRALALSQKLNKQTKLHGEMPRLKGERNPDIPAASKAIKMSTNIKFGTFIEATRNITLGDVLLIEEPYAFRVKKDFIKKYCSTCGELCFNMIPCDDCLTLYCSDKCKTEAFELYHQYECVVDRYFALNDEIDFGDKLPLRMTIRGLKDLMDNKHEKNTAYHSDCYEEIRNLLSHKENLLSHHAVSIGVLAKKMVKNFYLLTTHTNIKSKFKVSDDILKGMLFRNILISCVNSVHVKAAKSYFGYQSDNYGEGLYATYSRFNHACCPNIWYMFYGSTILLIARRNIKKGEQCFTEYAGNYQCDRRVYRQAMIKNSFFFDCDCKACVEDWPITLQLPNPLIQESPDYILDPNNAKTWKFNEYFYSGLKGLHMMLLSGVISHETIWGILFEIYKNMEPDPSPSYTFLEAVLADLYACNRHVEF